MTTLFPKFEKPRSTLLRELRKAMGTRKSFLPVA
jgi:hypothetical protein